MCVLLTFQVVIFCSHIVLSFGNQICDFIFSFLFPKAKVAAATDQSSLVPKKRPKLVDIYVLWHDHLLIDGNSLQTLVSQVTVHTLLSTESQLDRFPHWDSKAQEPNCTVTVAILLSISFSSLSLALKWWQITGQLAKANGTRTVTRLAEV